MKILVENSYTDGHESEDTVEVPDPPAGTTPDQLDEEIWNQEDGKPVILTSDEIASDQYSRESFWTEFVFEHTGDGHGDGSNGDLGSCYIATITEAIDPALVGASCEWID